jgi:hypothetical protein
MKTFEKIINYLRDALESKNYLGQLLYGLLDVIPGSSLIDLVQKILERAREVGIVEAIRERKDDTQWLRLFMQLSQMGAFAWLVARFVN